jgi:hypothetical protein
MAICRVAGAHVDYLMRWLVAQEAFQTEDVGKELAR